MHFELLVLQVPILNAISSSKLRKFLPSPLFNFNYVAVFFILSRPLTLYHFSIFIFYLYILINSIIFVAHYLIPLLKYFCFYIFLLFMFLEIWNNNKCFYLFIVSLPLSFLSSFLSFSLFLFRYCYKQTNTFWLIIYLCV